MFYLVFLFLMMVRAIVPIDANEDYVPEGFKEATEEEKLQYREEGTEDIQFIQQVYNDNKFTQEYLDSKPKTWTGIYDPQKEIDYRTAFSSVTWLVSGGQKSLSITIKSSYYIG
ncbi:hypothetical protein G7062_06515 [Erysipelothrix sp. HDW6C]|uniref:hypothetical protein n=1 Tax=Erysipelothrix sp. HDW6C TaxID=2714930 RepID=UPI0014098B22|nr:hypothetical protein [Erysipelothrix sp. HDW6C]QIK69961.1 hypothetical protein G7062_06515 [Erysipelothrix sp. HDW6C]